MGREVTIKEAAAMLGVCVDNARRMLNQARIQRSERRNGSVLRVVYDADAVQALADARAGRATSRPRVTVDLSDMDTSPVTDLDGGAPILREWSGGYQWIM